MNLLKIINYGNWKNISMGFILIEKYHMNKQVTSGTSDGDVNNEKPDFPLNHNLN